ncbi:probable LRR receptor-like serine/threonine-protein kinase IRK [Arachis ipaensis]|uniref:probable LRR receptor-like serine/threonine-protein kinase IRK n=1 Tax=Arachis ipaensis TaxID=130454 RepID=UPI0007AEED64|nr:probable LRR receptor-like serine/threonine-protein kinase IRK [Arachis ipaensis]XP_016180676.1 probable LRR receptor-like serine/threonine-protein kinase IRK [Arachis ipaensis]
MRAVSNMRVLLRFFFSGFLLAVSVAAVSPSLNDDVLGLIVFKADIQDPKGKLSSWNEDDDNACGGGWVGVRCNPRSNRVIELNLDGFSLSGKIGRGLLRLQFLRKLSLAKNNLTGGISANIAHIENLRVIDLSDNNLSGEVPDDFFRQCGSLRAVSLARNRFSGKVPSSLGSCSAVASIDMSSNQFSGSVPAGVWSLSGLRSLDLSGNLLEGEIPKGVDALKNLRSISLANNQISGKIPEGFGSCLLLRSVDFGENSLSGTLPGDLKDLKLCSYLGLRGNALSGEVPEWIGEMIGLETLDLSRNRFSGQVPNSVGTLQSLKMLNLSGNSFTNNPPESMANCTSLLALDVSHNSISGALPSWIFKSDLENVLVSENKARGGLKTSLFSLAEVAVQSLKVLDFSDNTFSGEIPSAIGGLSSLQFLNLSQNSLRGPIPAVIGELKMLSSLDLSENHLNGSIPWEIAGAMSLKELRLENNFLVGKIPTSIENCSSLSTLILAQNRLSGLIPAAVAKLTNLQTVDFSFNNLTGTLPKQLANLPNLVSFNLSHNNLQGELPAGGFFNTISPYSVSGNPSLCGSAVNRSCPAVMPKPIVLNPNTSTDSGSGTLPPTMGHKRIILSISALIAIGAAAVIIVGVIGITVLNLRVRATESRSPATLTFSAGDEFSHSPTTDANSGKLVMFSGEPDFSSGAHALLNKDCELGRGGFGAVYQTVLKDGRSVAIKKLTVSSLVKSQEDFEREVKKLGKVRHQNLVELEGYYWTPSLQLLISEYVSGGSLYKHLHEGSGGNFLSWNERFNVILGTAKALAHLHNSNIIHYNIKSTNVLLDSYGEPKVGDFGLARLLPMLDRYVLSSKIQSALGYMAPEFACKTVKITEKCDIYGFGVLVLEVVTGKRPVEYMEDDVVVLCDMVRGTLEEGRVEECIDERLQGKFPAEEAIPVMKLGLICTSQVPSNRPDMGEVVSILELIRCPSEEQEELV